MIIIIRCLLSRSTFRHAATDFYRAAGSCNADVSVEGGSDILRKESRKLFRHEVVRVGSEVIANFIDAQCQVKYSTKRSSMTYEYL